MACLGTRRDAYRVSVGRPEGRRPLGRPRGGGEDNVKKGSLRSGRRSHDLD